MPDLSLGLNSGFQDIRARGKRARRDRAADGHTEWVVALHMIEPYTDRLLPITLGASKCKDAENFIKELRSIRVTPHVARNQSGRRSAIDRRTTWHPRCAESLRARRRIEEAFGWIKTVGG